MKTFKALQQGEHSLSEIINLVKANDKQVLPVTQLTKTCSCGGTIVDGGEICVVCDKRSECRYDDCDEYLERMGK